MAGKKKMTDAQLKAALDKLSLELGQRLIVQPQKKMKKKKK
jgi:hypothetical protein|tara:strand:+ start:588 stop:710 length:123 start_codon:yes stop_codon:yes gene_type:complete